MNLLKGLTTMPALEGKRTYLAAYGLMLFAVLGYLLGQLQMEQATALFLNGMALAGLRAAK